MAVFDRAPTGALIQKPGLAGCISETGSGGVCTDGTALDGPRSVAVAADGSSVYVASDRAVAVFDRAPGGGLIQKPGLAGCISETGSDGACIDGTALVNPSSVAVTADGSSVYVATNVDGVAVFDRAASGALIQKPGLAGCISETGSGGACTDGTSLNGAISVAVSVDGSSVYVASAVTGLFASGAVAVFDRAADGTLTQKPGITPIVALSLAASSDGKSVYVTRAFRTSAIDEPLDNGSFVLFDRAVDGTLTGAGCISETGDGGACTDATALNGPISVAVSAEGSSVYVGSALSSAIAVFDRAISAPTPPAPAPAPPPGAPGLCANGLDDDGDGLVDASDPQCTAGRGREAPKDNPILACTGRPLMLTDVLAVGRRVRLAGLADPTLAGKTVLLSARGRIVARTTVRPDGAFVATTRRPASRDVRFQARVGDLRSLARKLDRRTIYTRTTRAARKVKMTGKVTARRRGRAIVELQIRRGCSKYRTVARARLRRDGRFTITIKAPSTTATIILRARIRLPGRGTTYSSPRTITPA